MTTARLGWVVVAIVVLAGAAYFFWPTKNKPSQGSASHTQTVQQGTANQTNDAAMSGTWKSTDDAKFTREFKADGTVTDRYSGDTSAAVSGKWSVVDPTLETNFPVPTASLSGISVIKVVWASGDIMYFGLNAVSETNLKLTNLSGRGNIMAFTKVQ